MMTDDNFLVNRIFSNHINQLVQKYFTLLHLISKLCSDIELRTDRNAINMFSIVIASEPRIV